MPPRIDPARREITVGSRRLPFRLDLRNDRVSVTLGGAETAVRPLQWREKVTLARFAELGPAFLRDEVIRLCTLTELPDTLAEEDAAVLWELAVWMSESPAATPMPLDSRSLASVTLRLCRAMGLRPADFDMRSAPEVEAMWGALGDDVAAAPPEEAASSSMTTRIVIVPDEVPPAAPAAAKTQVADAGRASARPVGVKPNVGSVQASPVANASQSIGAIVMSRAAAAPVDASPAIDDGQSRITVVSRNEVVDNTPTFNEPRGMEMTKHAAIEERGVDSIPASIAEQRGVDVMSFEHSRWNTALAIGQRHAAGTALAIEHRRGVSAAPSIDQRRVKNPIDENAVEFPAVAMPIAHPATGQAAPTAQPQHDFFEELADRLEQAAAEMGLGEE